MNLNQRYLAVSILVTLFLAAPLQAQRPLVPEEYGKWESLGRAVVSPDGHWLAVRISRVEGTSFLELRNLQNPQDPVIFKEGNAPSFSPDSRWLAYSIGQSEDDREKLRAAKKPIRNGLGLRDLNSGQDREYADVERFAFSEQGAYLAALQYKPEGDPGGDARGEGGALMVIDPPGDTAVTLAAVAEFAWQPEGGLLALAVQVKSGPGNGVQLYDPARSNLRVLESGDAEFSHLNWRKDSDDLAYFRKIPNEDYYEDNHRLAIWKGLAGGAGSRFDLDPTQHSSFPSSHRLVAGAGTEWSDSGDRVFVRIQQQVQKPVAPAREDQAKDGSEKDAPKPERSDVWVWHSRDERILPMQELQKSRDRNGGLASVWEPASNQFGVLAQHLRNNTSVSRNGRTAVELDERPYAFDNQFDVFGQADIYAIDAATGKRTRAAEGIWFPRGVSPQGRYVLYFDEGNFWSFDVETGTNRNLTEQLGSDFVEAEYDTPVREQKPPWGVGGWMANDEAVLLYDKYDVWWVPPDGKKASRLTSGTADKVVYRAVNLDPERGSPFSPGAPFNPDETIYFSLQGEWSKQHGFARLQPSERARGGVAQRLLLEDRELGGLVKAKEAPVMVFTRQDFDDSPDYYVSGEDLSGSRQVTATNQFQSDYAWGRSELIDYQSEWGQKLQGALYYPAGYVRGQSYPMIVYVYEKRAQEVHSYRVPSERSSYNAAVWTTQGYFVLEPDIVFKDRDPGISAVQCVRPAVMAVLAKGDVDASRVGLVGHSWGGYEASFIPTQTDIFATSIAGAPLTNFFSMFGTIHWNQGNPESSHFETGQARMEVPYWDDMEAYVRNSPVMHLQNLKTPMLVFFGDKDGTVDWHQGVELYNYARRAGKFLVMLVYPGENHSAREKQNQIDYQHRILDWFGHFLKGEEAAPWISDGVSALQRERWLKEGKK